MKKSKTSEEFEASLAELNRQPRSNNEIPADIFFRRRVRGNLWRKISDPNEVICKKKKSETSAKTEHELPRLELGQLVRIQNPKSKIWEEKAKIIGIMKSYLLENTKDNRVSRKNRRFLKPVESAELTEQRHDLGPQGPEKREKYCGQQSAEAELREEKEINSSSNLTPRRSERLKQKLSEKNTQK